jgi:hypothetical protein
MISCVRVMVGMYFIPTILIVRVATIDYLPNNQ